MARQEEYKGPETENQPQPQLQRSERLGQPGHQLGQLYLSSLRQPGLRPPIPFTAPRPQAHDQPDQFELSQEAIAALIEYENKISNDADLKTKRRVVYDSQISSSDPSYLGLSIDGGGIRGLMSAIWLTKLEELIGDKPNLYKAFDCVGGTSVGGIIALGVAHGIKASVLEELLVNQADKVFSQRLKGPLKIFKGLSSFFTSSYDHEPLENLLKEMFSETPLREARIPVLITSCTAKGQPFLFESHGPTKDFLMWEAARCTSAAPTYFKGFDLQVPKSLIRNDLGKFGTEESNNRWYNTKMAPEPRFSWKVDSQTNQVIPNCNEENGRDTEFHPLQEEKETLTLFDGGVWMNNPSMLVLASILRDKQADFRQTYLLSLGTGTTAVSSRAGIPQDAGLFSAIQPTIDALMESNSMATDITIESMFSAQTAASIQHHSRDYKITYNGRGRYEKTKRYINYCRLNPVLYEPIMLDGIKKENIATLKNVANDPTTGIDSEIESFYDDVIRLKLENGKSN